MWTWTALDADTKLIVSLHGRHRDADAATEFMHDVALRLNNRVQLTTDGHAAYLRAVEGAFGMDVDYAMLVKRYGPAPDSAAPLQPRRVHRRREEADHGRAGPKPTSARPMWSGQNLSIRMGNRRFTRLTNAFSKKIDNHIYMLALYFTHLQFLPHPQDAARYPGDGGWRR